MSTVTMTMAVLLLACHEPPSCEPGQLYVDGDGDGAGAGARVSECVEGTRYARSAGDCDDGDPAISPTATEVCDGRVVSTLEGGYDLDGLAGSLAAHLDALIAHAEAQA